MPQMTAPAHLHVMVPAPRRIASRIASQPVGHFLGLPPVADDNRYAIVPLLGRSGTTGP